MHARPTRRSATVAEGSRDHELHHPRSSRPRRRRLVALALAFAVLGACGGEGSDDLSPGEPEAGEEDTEVVPGEGGPVD